MEKAMPQKLRTLYEEVQQEYLRLEDKWEVIHALFGEKEDVDLVNSLGRNTAYLCRTIEEALFTEMILGVCRFTDPAFTGKHHPNLSLHYLLEQAATNGDQGFLQTCREDLLQLESVCSGIREVRNKKKAHKDKAVALRAVQIGGVPYTHFRDAMVQIGDFLNMFGGQYGEPPSLWDLDLRGAASPIWEALKLARKNSSVN